MSSPILSIPYASIIVEDRARHNDHYGNIEELAQSIARLGTIQPIVLARSSDNTYRLVAGGRRHRALGKLDVPELFHGSTLDPARPGFIFADEVPLHVQAEAELEENLYRMNMRWIDEVLQVYKIHRLKKSQDLRWGHAQTGALLNVSRHSVMNAINVAKCLIANDEEISACNNLEGALQLLQKRASDKALGELQKRNAAKLANGGMGPIPKSISSVLDTLNLTAEDVANSIKPIEGVGPVPTPVLVSSKVQIPLSQQFHLGPCVDLMLPRDAWIFSQFPAASIDHVVTDIPYGIDMANLSDKDKGDVEDEHTVEGNVALMLPFLQESFRVLKPGGFCIFWYDLDHHQYLQDCATIVGFRVQRWPLTWVKTHPCRNNAAAYNFCKTTEVAMVLRRDETSVLRKAQTSSWFQCEGSTERKLYNNKFAKPFALWQWLYEAITFPGQSVLDPFNGERSASRAAAMLGLIPFGIELTPIHFNRGDQVMRDAYNKIHNGNVEFI